MKRLLNSTDFWEGFVVAFCSPLTVFKLPTAPKKNKSNLKSSKWTDVGSSTGAISG